MWKASVVGHFCFEYECVCGQIIKTKVITQALIESYGEENISKIDTHGWIRKPMRVMREVLKTAKQSHNMVMLPAHNGVKIFAPLLHHLKNRYCCDIHYVVIGGWLPEFLQKRKWLAKVLKKFDGIYVETNTMKIALEEQGFSNIFVMPNCKKLTLLSEQELVYPEGVPYRLCTFSRVMREKGIETAVNAVRAVNAELGHEAFSLDIYGQVEPEQAEWFEELQKSFPDYVRYCGCVPADKSVEVLRSYFALLFPTHFYTEGIPGTIIDGYAAGIPVISAKWESYFDVVDDGKTGIGYEFGSEKQFAEILLDIARDPEKLMNMKVNCLEKAGAFLPQVAVQVLLEHL